MHGNQHAYNAPSKKTFTALEAFVLAFSGLISPVPTSQVGADVYSETRWGMLYELALSQFHTEMERLTHLRDVKGGIVPTEFMAKFPKEVSRSIRIRWNGGSATCTGHA